MQDACGDMRVYAESMYICTYCEERRLLETILHLSVSEGGRRPRTDREEGGTQERLPSDV